MTAKYEGPVGWRFLGEVADCRELQPIARLMAAEELGRVSRYIGKKGVRWARKELAQGTVIVRAELFGEEGFPAFRPKVLSWLVPILRMEEGKEEWLLSASGLFHWFITSSGTRTGSSILRGSDLDWEYALISHLFDNTPQIALCDWQGAAPAQILLWRHVAYGARYNYIGDSTNLYGHLATGEPGEAGTGGQLVATLPFSVVGATQLEGVSIAVCSEGNTCSLYYGINGTEFTRAPGTISLPDSSFLFQDFLFRQDGTRGIALAQSSSTEAVYVVELSMELKYGVPNAALQVLGTYDSSHHLVSEQTIFKKEPNWTPQLPFFIYYTETELAAQLDVNYVETITHNKIPIAADYYGDEIRYIWAQSFDLIQSCEEFTWSALWFSNLIGRESRKITEDIRYNGQLQSYTVYEIETSQGNIEIVAMPFYTNEAWLKDDLVHAEFDLTFNGGDYWRRQNCAGSVNASRTGETRKYELPAGYMTFVPASFGLYDAPQTGPDVINYMYVLGNCTFSLRDDFHTIDYQIDVRETSISVAYPTTWNTVSTTTQTETTTQVGVIQIFRGGNEIFTDQYYDNSETNVYTNTSHFNTVMATAWALNCTAPSEICDQFFWDGPDIDPAVTTPDSYDYNGIEYLTTSQQAQYAATRDEYWHLWWKFTTTFYWPNAPAHSLNFVGKGDSHIDISTETGLSAQLNGVGMPTLDTFCTLSALAKGEVSELKK